MDSSGVRLQRLQQGGDLGEDGLEGGERIALLEVALAAPALLVVVGLIVAAVGIPPVRSGHPCPGCLFCS